ncbi:head-tail adaptor protein [Roseomonas xinghualingensis]|uniref:head-tail adaptor protein n=1 Tax=Roseomonas xinghualingensis TaxID=2986475 RepID=UPI0021F0D811|nr:head-tail adaptor protein [Roseomonas sp. SXEYE001]MCV4209987.1 head-tail adaptor protein [Roseomonas sp. SXEYE001]
MALSAGRLRHRLVLEQRSSDAPDFSLQDTFTPVAEVWGAVEAVRGSVYAAGLQLEERITHRITLRYRNPTTFDHIRQDGTGHRFKVRDARDVDGRRIELEVMAEEVTAPHD